MKSTDWSGYHLAILFQKYFTEKFEKEKIVNACFELFPIDRIEFSGLVKNKSISLSWLTVTIPIKNPVINYLDSLDEKANAVGAVNCISIPMVKLKGYNILMQ